jgi:hypothetical protein
LPEKSGSQKITNELINKAQELHGLNFSGTGTGKIEWLSSNYNSYLNKSTSSATVYTFINQANNNICKYCANNKP